MDELKIASGTASARSISDDDLCAGCARCNYRPGDTSVCAEGWPTAASPSEYVLDCPSFVRLGHEEVITGEVRILGFGMAPAAVKMGYGPIVELFHGTETEAKDKFAGQNVVLVTGPSISGREDAFEFAVMGPRSPVAAAQGVLS